MPFFQTLNKCGIAISDPSTLCRYHSEVRQEAVQQALAAMNDKPKQVGRIIHNILMVADTNVHKTRKNIFTFFYLSVILNFCPSDFYFPVDAGFFQDMIMKMEMMTTETITEKMMMTFNCQLVPMSSKRASVAQPRLSSSHQVASICVKYHHQHLLRITNLIIKPESDRCQPLQMTDCCLESLIDG